MGAGPFARSAWSLLLALALGCTTDHDQLAKQPRKTTGGSAETTNSGGSTGSGGAASVNSGSVTTSAAGGAFPYTPDGDDVLTLVHGEVDAERIAFCFARVVDGERRLVDAEPQPNGGLPYGSQLSLAEPGGLSFEDDTIVPVVLAGDIERVEGEACDAALDQAYWAGVTELPQGLGGAGQGGQGGSSEQSETRPALRAMALPALPAGTLVKGRNYLMVIAGCMGGPGVTDETGVYCGEDFSARESTLRPLLVPVSRQVMSGRLSLQFLHASPATSQVDFRSRPFSGGPGLEAALSFGLSYGTLSPSTPKTDYSVDQLGIPEGANLDVLLFNRRELAVPWQEAAERGGATLEDGESYVIVLLGPSLGTDSDDGFNASTLTIVGTGVGRNE